MTNHVNSRMMIDLETLDTADTAVVISAGIVIFDNFSKKHEVEFMLNMKSQFENNKRTISVKVVSFWLDQSISPVNKSAPLMGIGSFISEIESIWHAYDCQEVWSCGSFDIDIINNMFAYEEQNPPWDKHWRIKDFRSVRDLFRDKATYDKKRETRHNALADAVAQVDHLLLLRKLMMSMKESEK